MLEVEQHGPFRYLVDGRWRMPLQAFADCRKRWRGSVILLASGPSAADFPLERYRGIPLIAMNGSILRCVEAQVAPLFYLCDDPGFVRDRPHLAELGVRQSEHMAMSLDCLRMLHAEVPGVLERRRAYLLERVNRLHGRAVVSDRAYAWSIRKDPDLFSGFSLWRSKPNRIGFSRDMGKGYFGGRTIPYAALQLACHLGFERVFLVGVDLSKSVGRFYEKGHAALPSSLDEDYEEYILPSFRLVAEKVLPSTGMRLYNLSSNSRLPEDIAPKIDLTHLDRLLAGQAQ